MDSSIIIIFGMSFGISIVIISCSFCYLQMENEQDDIEYYTIHQEEYPLLKR